MNDDVVKKLEYWAFKLCGKGEQEDAASDVMSEALKEIIKLRDETERLTRERDEARAEVEQWRRERRERIATAALRGMLESAGNVAPNEWSYYVFATRAIEYADALIAELDKEPQP